MKKVLIATHSETLSEAIQVALEDKWEVHTAFDGYTAVDTLRYLNPEGLILSLDLIGKDGLEVLNECFPDIPPTTLALASYINEYIAHSCFSLGVRYLMRLPCEASAIRNRLNEIWESIGQTPTAVVLHLRLLGFPEDLDGYDFLLSAIPFFAADMTRQLHKEVYPYVCSQCNATSVEAVEHSIREAIKKAWKSRNEAVWSRYFEIDNTGKVRRPSNRRFIKAISKRL